ncbi:hypothetical protein [Burkholderia cepacia]|uniref:hypothetical protein n=1 Tax=Burkholderia cepacia TaxID=292 RepID=UPI001F3CB28E|nr:hypothetical protein [Burkholderia cepacia]MCE4125810.1 hypothetical protein [Burkholderia cepacia]
MSIRTLIEINHDHLCRLRDDPEFLKRLIADLGSSFYCGDLNRANEEGKPLVLRNGIRIVSQYHHTTDVTVTSDFVEVKL